MSEENIQLRIEKEFLQENIKELKKSKEELTHHFSSLSQKALRENSQDFLKLAEEKFKGLQANEENHLKEKHEKIHNLLHPMHEKLNQFNQSIHQLESSRQNAYGALTNQVNHLIESQKNLTKETHNLSSALNRSSSDAGRWGELQLKRVIELSGMKEHCDFNLQPTFKQGQQSQRPDMVIRLPGGQNIIIDAKAPVSSYLSAIEEKEDMNKRNLLMQEYVKTLRNTIKGLEDKSYWKHVQSPEFVVLFLPAEAFYSSALEYDHTLIEDSFAKGIILATPSTLLTLLKTAAYGWRQESLAQNAQEIANVGTELYARLSTLAQRFARLGKFIESSTKAFNETIGSLEGSLLPCARKLHTLGAKRENKTLPDLAPIETNIRSVTQPELQKK